jgi:hypothetical protein
MMKEAGDSKELNYPPYRKRKQVRSEVTTFFSLERTWKLLLNLSICAALSDVDASVFVFPSRV